VWGELKAYNAVDSGKKSPWIEVIRISPDNKYVAFGTHEGRSHLEIGQVNKTAQIGKRLTLFSSNDLALSSALTHLDWSQDSTKVQLNSQAYELMFVSANVKNNKKQDTASSSKTIEWATYSILHGWATQGIWPGVDYTDVNTADRSHDGQILATGDDFGRVKLFKFPCVEKKAQF